MDDFKENENQNNSEFENYNEETSVEDIFADDSSSPKYEGFEEYNEDSKINVVPLGHGPKNTHHSEEVKKSPVRRKKPAKKADELSNLTPEEKAMILAKRARIKKAKKRRQEQNSVQKSNRTTIIVFGVLLFVVFGVYFSMTNMMPEKLMSQGKKYLEVEEYQKAYELFKKASFSRPYDEEALYYQAIALSKMPPTFETQQALYDITQLEDVDKASDFADAILLNMKKQIDRKVGSNYVGNALYEDILFRWNNKQPITYFIGNTNSSSADYLNAVRRAFVSWSTASNGEIIFKELHDSNNADIVITLLDSLIANNDSSRSGEAIVEFNKDKLSKVDVNLKTRDVNGLYNINKFKVLAQHEIGHALGIWGHSSNPSDVMYYDGDYIDRISPSKNISNRDANTLSLLYKMIPDIINKPIDAADKTNLFYHYVLTTIPGEDFEQETERLIAGLDKNSRDVAKWVDVAINYGIKKQYERSNSILKRILPLAQGDINNQFVVLYNMAANFYKMKDYKNAEKYLNLANTYNSDIDTQLLSALIDIKLNKIASAKLKLITLNDKHPENVDAAVKLAEMYYLSKDIAHSKQILDRLTTINPNASRDRRVMRYQALIAKKQTK